MLGEDEDADDDDAIAPPRRWSGRGPGEAGGSIARVCRLDLLVDELEGTG